jgi:hypothetical protein
MLVRSHNGRIDEDVLDFRFTCERMRDPLPDAFASPARETYVHRVPSTKLHWQIAPRTASASDPQYSFEKPAIVHSRSTTVAFLARQDRFDFLPYFVAQ